MPHGPPDRGTAHTEHFHDLVFCDLAIEGRMISHPTCHDRSRSGRVRRGLRKSQPGVRLRIRRGIWYGREDECSHPRGEGDDRRQCREGGGEFVGSGA